MSEEAIRVNVLNHGNDIYVQGVSTYQGKRPPNKVAKQKSIRLLMKAIKGLQSGEVHYVGFAEDDKERLRRDDWIIGLKKEKEESS